MRLGVGGIVLQLFRSSGFVAGGDEAGFFDAFDLGDASVVNGDLDRAKAEVADVGPDDFQPIICRSIRR